MHSIECIVSPPLYTTGSMWRHMVLGRQTTSVHAVVQRRRPIRVPRHAQRLAQLLQLPQPKVLQLVLLVLQLVLLLVLLQLPQPKVLQLVLLLLQLVLLLVLLQLRQPQPPQSQRSPQRHSAMRAQRSPIAS